MIKAILFDLDDLMVHSAPLHIEASRIVFRKHGIDIDKMPDDMVASYFGKPVLDILDIIIKYFKPKKEIDIKELNKEREALFMNMVTKSLKPMPGLETLVKNLKTTNFKRAVASSATENYIHLVLEKFKLQDFFQAVSSVDMVENGKPEPDIFLHAAKLLGVNPENCVVIEDAEHGVTAAKKAGMFCIAVKNSLSKYSQNLSKADAIVNRLDEIDIDLIKSIISVERLADSG